MTRPTGDDRRHDGTAAQDLWESNADGTGSTWWPASVDEVRENMAATGYPHHLLHFIVGPVESTLRESAPTDISLLRLDTDWYESTAVEMDLLYPRLVEGGCMIIDGYGWWTGSRRAVDEYFERMGTRPLLARIDPAGARMHQKAVRRSATGGTWDPH